MSDRSQREKTRKTIYRRCQTVKRRLETKGVSAIYRRGSLSGLRNGDGFTVRFSPSEGSTLNGHVTVTRHGAPMDEFHGDRFEEGMSRILDLFTVSQSTFQSA
jgi:hypothetical protein